VTENTLTGKVALVTGGSKGIGKAIAIRLAEKGVKVAINYNSSEDAAENLVKTIRESGGMALKVRADVSKLAQVKAMISNISNEWGGVNILVNNAGIIDDRLLVRMSDDSWQRVIDVNLNGTFYTTRSVLKDMMRERWGRIINIGSVVALRGNPAQTNYTASKAAIIGFTKALAKEVATRGITVNVIAPGYFETETTSVLSDDQRNRWLSLIPQGHFGDVDDVAHMAAYLADDKANYVTGQVISVDGGMAV
jgi:3-oxoacyl-[acyl-carrier protein] reductase